MQKYPLVPAFHPNPAVEIGGEAVLLGSYRRTDVPTQRLGGQFFEIALWVLKIPHRQPRLQIWLRPQGATLQGLGVGRVKVDRLVVKVEGMK